MSSAVNSAVVHRKICLFVRQSHQRGGEAGPGVSLHQQQLHHRPQHRQEPAEEQADGGGIQETRGGTHSRHTVRSHRVSGSIGSSVLNKQATHVFSVSGLAEVPSPRNQPAHRHQHRGGRRGHSQMQPGGAVRPSHRIQVLRPVQRPSPGTGFKLHHAGRQ